MSMAEKTDDRLSRMTRGAFYAFVLFLPFSISGAQIMLGLLLALQLLVHRRRRRPVWPPSPAGALILALVVWTLAVAPFAVDFRVTGPRLFQYWIWAAFFVAVPAVAERRTLVRGLELLVVVSGLVAVYAALQHLFGNNLPLGFHGFLLDHFGEAAAKAVVPVRYLPVTNAGAVHALGFFDHHLTYGNSLMLVLLLGLGWWTAVKSWRRRLLLTPFLLAALTGLTWSYARSAWVGLLAGLLTFGALKGRRVLIVLLLAVFAAGLTAYHVSPAVADRLGRAFRSDSNLERIYIYKTTVEMIRDHPLTGVGRGNYRRLIDGYRTGYNIHWTAKSHAHNSYLQLAAESGLFAGLLFAALLAYLIALGVTRCHELKGDDERRELLLGVTAATVGFAIASLLQHNAGDAEVCLLWQTAAAMLVVLARPRPAAYDAESERNHDSV